MESESSTSPDFTRAENQLRTVANKRLLKLLKDPDAEVPPGQLMAFVAKVGFNVEATPTEAPAKIGTQNIFAILGGLPEDRQKQILDGFQAQITKARKELPSG